MNDVSHDASLEADYQELMPPWAYSVAAVTLFFIGFFGFFLNLFVLALMYKDIQLWTPMNIILFNLVCSDFSVSIIGNPLTLTSAISHRWLFGSAMCVAYGFFMSLLGITSITTLTVLSYERFCLISHPFTAQNRSKRGACCAVLFIWSYSFALTSPPLFGWGAYVSEAANISCSVNWESQTANATSYIIFLFLFGLIVPLVVIIYSYTNIVLNMRKNSARVGRVNRAERRVTAMVAVMIVAFMVAWTPYAIFALIEQFGPAELIGPGLAVLPALIAKSSICYNPVIYVGMNTQFRAAFQRVRRAKGQPGSNNNNTTSRERDSQGTTKDMVECSLDFCHWKIRTTKDDVRHSRSDRGSRGDDADGEPYGTKESTDGAPGSGTGTSTGRSLANVLAGPGRAKVVHQDSELSVIHDGRILIIKSQLPRANML
ncbi:vertebrate ancient opsin-like [Anopheles ziemanni]|uniref:vertebrate ancient opsin-like n=1 Tax=Anopheles coustani TaxID=139045 RepID=UPI00265A3003|nr:vertebrate ancient opsin-like [Anopheles coustani]XP_058171838.1 vertebrate ancient opsin-like [Anopheles ziemanni]